jgi:hypothetical protein
MSSPLFGSSATVTVIAIAIILLASSFTTINAQPQQVTSQPGEFGNGASAAAVFQSTNDSFSIQVPDGWLAHDLNNTGTALQEEVSRGYGLLAQLCQEEVQQQQVGAAPPNATGGNSDTPTCQGAENNVIHIIRYPHLDTTLGANNTANTTTTTTNNITIDNVLGYHLQKLQEVGYNNIQVVNNTAITVNLTNPQTNQTVRTESADFVEMTYTTAAGPNGTRTGYFILTYTDVTAPLPVPTATSPNLGTTKGYALFYEGNSTANNTALETTTAGLSSSLAAASLPLTVAQVLNSFELTIAPEVAQALAQQEAQAVETIPEETTEEEVDDGDDNGADEDDGDDNGADEDDGDDNGADEEEEDLDDCIIIGTGNVEDDCDITPDDDDDDDGAGAGAGDDDGAGAGAGDDDGA